MEKYASYIVRQGKLLLFNNKEDIGSNPFGHVTDAVEENILALGIMPIRSDAGVMNISAPGRFRNQFHQHVTLQENIGRILGAWPAVYLSLQEKRIL